MRILKYKYKDGVSFIKYEKNTKDTKIPEQITLETYDVPLDILPERLQAMARHVTAICELPDTITESLTVIGITITYSGDSQGLVITALRELENSNSPMVINTPHFTRTDSDKNVYSTRCGIDLDALVEAIKDFINGDRAQKQLFDFSEYTKQPESEAINERLELTKEQLRLNLMRAAGDLKEMAEV
jgi:hypothetical protein